MSTSGSHQFTAAELAQQLAAERAGQPFLVYRDASGAQRLLTLEGPQISIGREPGNELILPWDREASRVHALLEPLGQSWTLVDDDLSRNGTFVNGIPTRGRRRLSDRDVVRFGSTQVLYRDPTESPVKTLTPANRGKVAGITSAQRRVLTALCRPLLEQIGLAGAPSSNREIAMELSVSVDAVRGHLKTLFKLFEVPDLPQNQKRAELADRALTLGVVLPRDM